MESVIDEAYCAGLDEYDLMLTFNQLAPYIGLGLVKVFQDRVEAQKAVITAAAMVAAKAASRPFFSDNLRLTDKLYHHTFSFKERASQLVALGLTDHQVWAIIQPEMNLEDKYRPQISTVRRKLASSKSSRPRINS